MPHDETSYSLAREQQELALSQAPGDPAAQAIHRAMARLYAERTRNNDIAQPAADVQTKNRT